VSWTQARSRVAVAVRDGAPAEVVADLRRDLHAERLISRTEELLQEIRAAADADPPLTTEQRSRLAGLLAPVAVRPTEVRRAS